MELALLLAQECRPPSLRPPPPKGASALRYRQVLDERFGLDAKSLSSPDCPHAPRSADGRPSCELAPKRMADFDSLDGGPRGSLGRLGRGTDPLVRCLAPPPVGQKEELAGYSWSRAETAEPDPTLDSGTDVTRCREYKAAPHHPQRTRCTSLRGDVDALRPRWPKSRPSSRSFGSPSTSRVF